MSKSAADYKRWLLDAMPPGRAWARDPDSVQGRLLGAIAEELARVDAAAAAIATEAWPGTATEEVLLDAWEAAAGLPDPCVTSPPTLEAERQAELVARLVGRGSPTPQFFIDLAAALGYAVTITENQYASVDGVFVCGEPLVSGDQRSVFIVNGTSGSLDEVLECLINRYKPAHTTAVMNLS